MAAAAPQHTVHDQDVAVQPPARTRRRTLTGYLLVPAILALACLALYLYVGSQELDSIEARALAPANLAAALGRHLQLTAVSTLLTLVIAVPLGILFTRPA